MMVSLVTFSYRLHRCDKSEGMCVKEIKIKAFFFFLNKFTLLSVSLIITYFHSALGLKTEAGKTENQ